VNSTLKSLELCSTKIKSEGVGYLCEAISQSQTLTHLDLSENWIGNVGAKYLVQLLSLVSCISMLELCNCYISTMLCEELCVTVQKKCPYFLGLNLGGNYSDAVCVEKLVNHRNLIWLELGKSKELGKGAFAKVRDISRRNRDFWEERIRIVCILIMVSRVLVLGGGLNVFPLEMLHHILRFIPSDRMFRRGVINKKQVKKLIKHASDISTFGTEIEVCLEGIFGKGMGEVPRVLRNMTQNKIMYRL